MTTVIDGINYCIVVLHQQSWMDELNSLPPEKVMALITSTALIWYVASAVRIQLQVLAHDETKET
ncbi:hypothetical protein [Acinetobacter venetianus]|uniref:hypothetical protein n=1 Tax=Acinetobacter venetianus TaxID=52133 RepID=UPI003850B9D8